VTQTVFCVGALMSQVLQCRQFWALRFRAELPARGIKEA
jgi:hypothetical protein